MSLHPSLISTDEANWARCVESTNQSNFRRISNLEYVCISGQRSHAFLNACTTGVIHSNQRSSNQHGLVHYLHTTGVIHSNQRSTNQHGLVHYLHTTGVIHSNQQSSNQHSLVHYLHPAYTDVCKDTPTTAITRNEGQCPTWWPPYQIQVAPYVQRLSLAEQ